MSGKRIYTDDERLERKRIASKISAARLYAIRKQDPEYVAKLNTKSLNDYYARVRPFPDKMEKRRARIKGYQQKRRERFNEVRIRLQQLLGGACADCGLTDPRLLDFDHIDPATKTMNISQGLSKPLDVLVEEVQKCELRCPNCHRLRTLREGHHNGYKHRTYRNGKRRGFRPLN